MMKQTEKKLKEENAMLSDKIKGLRIDLNRKD